MNPKYVLYQDPWCPFCRRVTALLEHKDLSLPMRDVARDVEAYKELVRGGGRGTVPCLRIAEEDGSEKWLYESADIIELLDREIAS